ncbi:MAG: DUF4249 family protein [Bacteroidetes bacterium]|nr:DUF4249 family protein [Bacteroidota bacterium]
MKKTFIVITSLLLLAACEQTVDTNDWPAHDEKLVVTGYLHLEHDSIFTYARVNRTLPLGEKFDLRKAMVNDAELRVENGNRSFPINWVQGFYPYDFDFNYSAVVARGDDDDFVLTVKQGGKIATAEIHAKTAPTRFTDLRVERSSSGYEMYDVSYSMPAPGADTDLRCLIEYWTSDFGSWYEMYTLELPSQPNRPGGILQGTFQLWAYARPGSKPRIRYTLIARNRAYQDYINSRWDWSGGDSPFDPPQKNPAFNVTGDGIGFFWYEIVGEPVEIVY